MKPLQFMEAVAELFALRKQIVALHYWQQPDEDDAKIIRHWLFFTVDDRIVLRRQEVQTGPVMPGYDWPTALFEHALPELVAAGLHYIDQEVGAGHAPGIPFGRRKMSLEEAKANRLTTLWPVEPTQEVVFPYTPADIDHVATLRDGGTMWIYNQAGERLALIDNKIGSPTRGELIYEGAVIKGQEEFKLAAIAKKK